MTSCSAVTVKGKRGFAKLEWQKLRERNEALDCRVYARAAAWIVGADRWSEARWADLEAQLGVKAARNETPVSTQPRNAIEAQEAAETVGGAPSSTPARTSISRPAKVKLHEVVTATSRS